MVDSGSGLTRHPEAAGITSLPAVMAGLARHLEAALRTAVDCASSDRGQARADSTSHLSAFAGNRGAPSSRSPGHLDSSLRASLSEITGTSPVMTSALTRRPE
jgi:hypothetical protein